jgi:hypothetical protein
MWLEDSGGYSRGLVSLGLLSRRGEYGSIPEVPTNGY